MILFNLALCTTVGYIRYLMCSTFIKTLSRVVDSVVYDNVMEAL